MKLRLIAKIHTAVQDNVDGGEPIIESITPHNGHLTLSAFYGDELVKQTYIGYTMEEAKANFKDYYRNYVNRNPLKDITPIVNNYKASPDREDLREDFREALLEGYRETGVGLKDLMRVLYLIHHEEKIKWIRYEDLKIIKSKKKNTQVFITPDIQEKLGDKLKQVIKHLSDADIQTRNQLCRKFKNEAWKGYSHCNLPAGQRLFLTIEGGQEKDTIKLLKIATHDGAYKNNEAKFVEQLDNLVPDANIPYNPNSNG